MVFLRVDEPVILWYNEPTVLLRAKWTVTTEISPVRICRRNRLTRENGGIRYVSGSKT